MLKPGDVFIDRMAMARDWGPQKLMQIPGFGDFDSPPKDPG